MNCDSKCGVTIEVEDITEQKGYEITELEWQEFDLCYCVSYRHPSLPEWILARGYWNNLWIWIDDATWLDH